MRKCRARHIRSPQAETTKARGNERAPLCPICGLKKPTCRGQARAAARIGPVPPRPLRALGWRAPGSSEAWPSRSCPNIKSFFTANPPATLLHQAEQVSILLALGCLAELQASVLPPLNSVFFATAAVSPQHCVRRAWSLRRRGKAPPTWQAARSNTKMEHQPAATFLSGSIWGYANASQSNDPD